MNPRTVFGVRALCLLLILPGAASAARVVSDLQPAQKRQASVTLAETLARPAVPAPLPADIASPFNPPGVDKPEPGEIPVAVTPGTDAAPPPPPGDREILEAVAAQLTPTGTINFDGSSRLVMGSKRFEVGTRFTVTYNNQDHELELVAIDRTTFTLRYRGEEFTRPIKSVR
ncbi:MAG: hypothetical protein ACREH8_10535 [Opitutaceae bacterium]